MTPQGVPDAIRTIAQGLVQLADALDAGGAVVPLAPIVYSLTNGHQEVAKSYLTQYPVGGR